jgi:hypothetical protein
MLPEAEQTRTAIEYYYPDEKGEGYQDLLRLAIE